MAKKKSVNNYILLVDNYRRPERKRNTAGRYRVGAKSEKEAVKLLRNKIGFGSIQVYYKCNENDIKIANGMVVKETTAGFQPSRHATAPIEK